MAVIGECGGDDIGDIIGMDEGSRTVLTGSAISPARIGPSSMLSLKFCMNQLARTMVQSAPEACSLLGALGFGLAAAGEEDETLDAL